MVPLSFGNTQQVHTGFGGDLACHTTSATSAASSPHCRYAEAVAEPQYPIQTFTCAATLSLNNCDLLHLPFS